MSSLEIKYVNKYDSPWNPDMVFTGFLVRAVLRRNPQIITRQRELSDLRRRLENEVGEEGSEWMVDENPITQQDELYLLTAAKLIMWKLQDAEKFIGMVDFVEQHTTDPEKFAEQEQREKDKKAAEIQAKKDAEEQRWADANPDKMTGPGTP